MSTRWLSHPIEKNIGQIGSFRSFFQVGVGKKNAWNHHLENEQLDPENDVPKDGLIIVQQSIF